MQIVIAATADQLSRGAPYDTGGHQPLRLPDSYTTILQYDN